MFERAVNAIRTNRTATIAGAGITVLGLAAAVIIGLPPPFMIGLLVAFGLVTRVIYRRRAGRLDPAPSPAPGGMLASSALAAALIVFVAAQAVPYGRDHSNPPITGEPDWATPKTRELMDRACFDCHSNEVEWPWYSNIAPMSWTVWKHVKDGRNKVNYSEFDRPQREADESFEEVEKGSMPPPYYTFGGLHPDANLTDAEFSALLDGLRATPGLSE
jgi:hypothetical protein